MKAVKNLLLCLLAGLMVLSLGACSKKEADSRTLAHFKNAFKDAGMAMEEVTEPAFSAIGATAGTMFTEGGETVKVYMYESEEALEKAKKDFASTVKNFEQNGRFLLETTSDKAKEAFKGVKR